MNITEFAVKNRQFSLVAFLGIVFIGLTALLTMPRGEDPPYHAPTYVIVAIYPGAGAEEMEKLVAKPVEKRIRNLEKIKEISTTIREGVAVFQVDYLWGVDIDDKYQELTREIAGLRSQLPANLTRVDIRKASSSDVKIFQWALTGDVAPGVFKLWADRLKDTLTPLKALKAVDVWGVEDPEIRVDLDTERLAAWGITPDQVAGAVQQNNLAQPAGSVGSGSLKLDAKTSGELSSVEELQAVLISGSKALRLSDVATVAETYPTRWKARFNGSPAVWVTASMHDGQNIQAVADHVAPLVAEFSEKLPPELKLVTVFDQPKGVSERLGRFSKDFLLALALVLLTLLPLGFRASLVVMVAIPVSLAIGVTAMYVLGYTINQLSIVGMIVALGILVDDSIVVVENTERWLRSGHSPQTAVLGAAKEISLAITGVTALVVLAFLPLLFLPAGSGDFIRSLPIAVVSAVIASLLVALTVVPFLNRALLKESSHGNVFYRWFDRWLIQGTEPLVRLSLSRPKLTLVAGLGLAVGSLGLLPVIGSSLFPASEKPMFLVNVNLPAGSRLEATDAVALRVESLLTNRPGIASVATNVGHDNPQVYYNVSSGDDAENRAQLLVQLTSAEAALKRETIADLRHEVEGWAGVKIEIKEFQQGPPVVAPVAFLVKSDDLGALDHAAARVAELLTRTPGTLYVDNPLEVKPLTARIEVNAEKVGQLGLSAAAVGRAVRLALGGQVVGSLKTEGDDDRLIRFTLASSDRLPDFSVLDRIMVPAPGGTVPLSQVAAVSLESGIASIRHLDAKRSVTVGAFVAPGFNVAQVNAAVETQLAGLDLGDGVSWSVSGEAKSGSESFSGLQTIILISVFGFLGVLVLEFRSFKSLVIVLSIIPLGFIGAFGMLWAFHETFSFTATVGLIALTGIEIKNSLLFVDFANQLRRGGMDLEQAVLKAGRQRFLPILLTSMTAVGGLIPLVLEYSPLYSPLAMVLIGGIISSTILARFVTPVVYTLVAPQVEPEEQNSPRGEVLSL